MIHRPLALILAAGMALAVGPATARPLKPAEEARIKPVGKAESCVQISQIDHTRVRSDNVIDFYMHGNKVYRNTLPQGCPQLGFREQFSYGTSINQLCSVDIITVLTSTPLETGASCGLGQFQQITGAPRG